MLWRRPGEQGMPQVDPSGHIPAMDVQAAPSRTRFSRSSEDHEPAMDVHYPERTAVPSRPVPTQPMADAGPSGNNRSGRRVELQLVRSLGEVILRAQEVQVERILEQGRRLEETLNKQQSTLAAIEKQVAVSPPMPSFQAAVSHKTEPQPMVISKLEPKLCRPEDDVEEKQLEETQLPSLEPSRSKTVDLRMAQLTPSGIHTPSRTTRSDRLVSVMSDSTTNIFDKVVDTVMECPPDDLAESQDASLWAKMRSVVIAKNSETEVPNRCGATFVMSNAFGLLVGFMIFLNGILIIVQTDHAARNQGRSQENVYISFETVFFFIFAMELALRIWVFRKDFFIGEDLRWNYFDLIIVLAAAAEEIVKLIELGGNHFAKRATFLRTIRILKLGRIMRIFRVVKLFRDLRIMLSSIIATMMTLFWSIICLVMIMITFATYFLTVVNDHLATNGVDPNLDLHPYWGSMSAAVLCLFQITTGGFDWREASNQLMEFSPLSVAVLCIYISMMNYAVLNILTGICCNTANKTAEDDFDITSFEERKRNDAASAKLAKYLHEHNVSGDGQITWKEVESYLNNPQVRSCFNRLDLEHWHIHSFFQLLGADDDSETSIDIDHFIRGCVRFRCNVKNIDLIASSHEEHKASKKYFAGLQKQLDEVQSLLQSHQLKYVTNATEALQ